MYEKKVEIQATMSRLNKMNFRGSAFIAWMAFALLGSASIRAESIAVGTLIDDSGWLFSSFGNQYTLGSTRGANFNGSGSVTWYGVNLSIS